MVLEFEKNASNIQKVLLWHTMTTYMYENGSDSELGQSYLTYKDGRRCNGKFFEKF